MDYGTIDQAFLGLDQDSARRHLDDFIGGHRSAWSELRNRGTVGAERYDQTLRSLESMRTEASRDRETGAQLSLSERQAILGAMGDVNQASALARMPDRDIGECRAPQSAPAAEAASRPDPAVGNYYANAPYVPEKDPAVGNYFRNAPYVPEKDPAEGNYFRNAPYRPSETAAACPPEPEPSIAAGAAPRTERAPSPARAAEQARVDRSTRVDRLESQDLGVVANDLERAMRSGDHNTVNRIVTNATPGELQGVRRYLGESGLNAAINAVPNRVPGNAGDYRDALRVAMQSERERLSTANTSKYTDRLIKADSPVGIGRLGTHEATVHELLGFDDETIRNVDRQLSQRDPSAYPDGLRSFIDDNFWHGGAERDLLLRRLNR